MVTMRNGDCRISHREYIADIVAGTGSPSVFTVQSLPVNPGQVSTFQWLSRIAANFESYQFSKLKFDYATEAPSSLGGTLVLSLDYDASDPAPISKQQAMAYRSSVRSAPWAPCQHASIGEDLKKGKSNFVRPGAQPANTDIKTYDIGNLYVISQGVTTASAVLGELWVEYDVLLMTPVFENAAGVVPVGGNVEGNNTLTAANPFGLTPTVDAQAYGLTMNDASRLTFKFPGYYLLTLYMTGTTITDMPVAPGPGVAVGAINSVTLAAATSSVFWFAIIVNGNNGYVDITATAATVTASEAYVGIAPPNSLAL